MGTNAWWSSRVSRKQDGGEQTSLTDAQSCHREVTHLSIENYCAAVVSVEFLDDLHQPVFNVKYSQNLQSHRATSDRNLF
ncbi:hypothetical protein DPMN_018059 [Dreissena polymorpha]|uniref:Uncharacterized protein n=1 Tax=Dreissena polymorpha TaxID=45954 RepID=A0A9D4NIQ1_DREPO|nr:hypothetical protein DPMN_018059 [Dreissena polymorpha]